MIQAIKKWYTKRRLRKLFLEVIREFYLHSIKEGSMDPSRITEGLGIQRIANNGFDTGGFIACYPFAFLFDKGHLEVALIEKPDELIRYDVQKMAEAWSSFQGRSAVRRCDILDFSTLKKEGGWWDDLSELAKTLEKRWKSLKMQEKYRARRKYHQLNTPS